MTNLRIIWTVCLLVLTMGSAAIAGERYFNLTGGRCPKGGEEGQGGPEGDQGKDNSDPIYLATGDFQHVQTDLFIPGRGLDFEIKRMYRSRSGLYSFWDSRFHQDQRWKPVGEYEIVQQAPLGMNWDFNYNMRVTIGSTLDMHLTNPNPGQLYIDQFMPDYIVFFPGDGRQDHFKPYTATDQPLGTPVYYSNDGFRGAIRYTLRHHPIFYIDPDQTEYKFLPFYDSAGNALPYWGRLDSITDRNGNQISFTYETSNGAKRIATATDTLGHVINFYYHDDPSSPLDEINDQYTAHLTWQIVDHAGRVVEYDYDGNIVGKKPELVKVTQPAIEDSAEFPIQFNEYGSIVDHARFQNGIVWEYEYSSSVTSTDYFVDGMLTKITDPNGVDIIQNEYEWYPDHRRGHGRVIRQQYGDAAYNYVVTDTTGAVDNEGQGHDYYVWVNDRRGAITRFKYAALVDPYIDPVGGPDQPRDRQLLEKVEFEGFVADPDLQVWGVCDAQTGDVISWKYYDTSGAVQSLPSGPTTSGGSGGVNGPWASHTTTWQQNRHWKIERIIKPNDDYVSMVFDDDADDPRRQGAMLSRTISSADNSESITEEWRYDHALFGSGCGCGTQGFETAYKDGRGFVTIKEYDSNNGNLLTVFHDLPIGTSMQTTPAQAQPLASAIDEYTYNTHGQILTHTHPAKFILDSSSNEVLHNRVDQFEYYSDTNDAANYGRLHKKHIDVNGEDLTTEYIYDIIGNVIKVIEPDGDVAKYYYNQHAQLIRMQRFDNGETTLFAQTDSFYDGNGNLVREEVLNLDGNQQLVSANKSITSVFEYDKLGFMTTASQEAEAFTATINEYAGIGRRAIAPVSDPAMVSEQWIYDAGQNLTSHLGGEAVNGNQAENETAYAYDARGLMIRETDGVGSSVPIVTEYTYDENMRIDSVIQDQDGLTQTQVYNASYDTFNRIRSILDPMGNEIEYIYDDNHNMVSAWICGPVEEDTTGSDTGVTLAKQEIVYDERDRKTVAKSIVYDYAYGGSNPTCGLVPVGATEQVTSYEYNEDSSLHEMTEQAGTAVTGSNITSYLYDTVGRLAEVLDGDGNLTQHTYDADSNVLTTTQTDVISELGSSTEEFVVTNGYDELDRLISVIDGVLNTTTMSYDSRSNMVERVDAKGNVTDYTYDGLNRHLTESRAMTDTGYGSGTSVGTIVRAALYDDSSRLIKETDDNGNETEYAYDGVNRLISIKMPDGEEYTAQYDHNGNLATYTDARGVVTTQAFDLNNRLEQRVINNSVLPDAGTVPYITQEDFTYDGLGRVRTAINDFTNIVREYDSRSNVVREIQNADAPLFPAASDRVVEYGFDLANNTTQITYPSGREVYRKFDDLNRMAGIYNDATMTNDPITEFVYIGNRVQRRNHGNDTQTVYAYNGYTGASSDPNDFGFGRVASISTVNTNTSVEFDAFSFTWDKNQNRTAYEDTGSGMKNRRERFLGYDSANRLISTDVDFPDPLTDFPSPTNSGVTDYTLDGVHNRTAVTGFESNGAPLGSYTQSGTQADNNQYTLTPRADAGDWVYDYDENGNLITKSEHNQADYTGDYVLDIFDVQAFQVAYNNQDPSADLNDDGDVDGEDTKIFMDEFQAASNYDLDHEHYSYDFRNQLVRISIESGTSIVSIIDNTYDPMARRLVEEIDLTGNGTAEDKRQFVYGYESLWEVIEQIDLLDNDTVLLTHVFGIGIDDEVSYRIEDLLTPEDFWTHRDDLGSVTSLTNENGVVVERYEYGDYGDVRILDASGAVLPGGSDYGVHHLYTGRSVIPGMGLMDYRWRVYSPETGRFVQRDPLWTLESQNLYQYVLTSPMVYMDPFGLERTIYTTTPKGGGGVNYTDPGLQDLHYLGPADSPIAEPLSAQNSTHPAMNALKIAGGAVSAISATGGDPVPGTPLYGYERYLNELAGAIEASGEKNMMCDQLQKEDAQPSQVSETSGKTFGTIQRSGRTYRWNMSKDKNGKCSFVLTHENRKVRTGKVVFWPLHERTDVEILKPGDCPATGRSCGRNCKKNKNAV